jgi:coproporphyrinogen III oxidase-like Fe-S oxidoreductase
MTSKKNQNTVLYSKSMHWPPYTYRDYPEANPKTLKEFEELLQTENVSKTRKELQPWIPFCNSKCSFCYFPTEIISKNKIEHYLEALKKCLLFYSKTKYVQTTDFSEIYLAGGTPSLMSVDQTIDLLNFCEKNFNMSDVKEIKITGCTHDFDYKKLKALSEYGVNQLDLGVQTFDDNLRQILNLRQKATEVEKTIKTARKLGLRVSVDLIFNLPGQTLEILSDDIQRALNLNVESADCYALELLPETELYNQIQSGKLPLKAREEIETKMYQETQKIFKNAGYKKTCHNRFSRIKEDFQEPCMEVIGTGAGFFMGNIGKFSYTDVDSSDSYIDTVSKGKFPISKLWIPSVEDEMGKMMMNLLIRRPVNKRAFKNKFGKLPEEAFGKTITKLVNKGLVETDDKEIRLTELGDIWRINICWEFFQPNKKL